jgi:hypothetical protein
VKNHGARNEVFNRGARKIRGIERALGESQVAGLGDEAGKLFVRDDVAIDPETVNSYFMDGTLPPGIQTMSACPASQEPLIEGLPLTITDLYRSLPDFSAPPHCVNRPS